MKNNFEIENDGINVYITFFVKSQLVGKILTSLLVLFLLGLLFYIPFTITKEEISEYLFPLIIFGIFVFTFPVRYLLWNLYGKENIIINTKSISYYRDYGVYRTSLKTVENRRLATGFEWSRTFDNIKYGNLVFQKYNDENNLPEHLYTTSVVLTFESLEKIDREISKIYEMEMEDEFDFFPISLN